MYFQSILHGGDNDSTGTIAGAWFGAFYGFQSVPDIHFKNLEGVDELVKIGKKIFEISGK